MHTAFGPKFDRILAWARRQALAPFSLRTRQKMPNNDFGQLIEYRKGKKKTYVIEMRKNQTLDMAIDVLLHEIAHLNDVVQNGWGNDHASEHNDNWGKHYSRLYRDYFDSKSEILKKKKGGDGQPK